MINIGITGQSGFIGSHLYNLLGQLKAEYTRIKFEDFYFKDQQRLNSFVQSCDFIIHLAAINRHDEEEILYRTNVELVEQIITACELTDSLPHIIFSSSVQEEHNNAYGKSKKVGKELFEQWAIRNGSNFTCLTMPNVFGPFCKPFYNSVVATFCYQLSHNIAPSVHFNANIELVYVGDLVSQIISYINSSKMAKKLLNQITIQNTCIINVTNLLEKLEMIKENYLKKGIITNIQSPFDRELFSTFLTYIDFDNFFPHQLKTNDDTRGRFYEILRFNGVGQVSVSTTIRGVTRGNHFHSRKIERFVVLKGTAKIEFRRIGTNKVFTFIVYGGHPSFVDIPIWHTHCITNIGDEELITLFWVNDFFNAEDSDTYFEEVELLKQ